MQSILYFKDFLWGHHLLSEQRNHSDSAFWFAGDFVDRGAWGLEVLLCVCALKRALPQQVFLLRGNHETGTISKCYGFQTEVKRKYSASLHSDTAAGSCTHQILASETESGHNKSHAKTVFADQLIQHSKGVSCC
jgi:hypothetical protein